MFLFKIKAENGNTTYYKINAVTNKRDKGVNVVLSNDNDTEEALTEIRQKYGTFVSDMHLVNSGIAQTSQVGIYDETGASGNNYCMLKFGNYDFSFNVPESAGYTYELYYTIDNKYFADEFNYFLFGGRGLFSAGIVAGKLNLTLEEFRNQHNKNFIM